MHTPACTVTVRPRSRSVENGADSQVEPSINVHNPFIIIPKNYMCYPQEPTPPKSSRGPRGAIGGKFSPDRQQPHRKLPGDRENPPRAVGRSLMGGAVSGSPRKNKDKERRECKKEEKTPEYIGWFSALPTAHWPYGYVKIRVA